MNKVAVLLVLAMVLGACSGAAAPAVPKPTLVTDKLGTIDDLKVSQAEIDAAKAVLGDKGLIGIVACNLSSEYHSTVPNSAKALADKLGLKAEIFDSETKAEKQISAIENFVSKGAKAIVLCVLDPKVIQSAVNEAAKQGVFIVQYAVNRRRTALASASKTPTWAAPPARSRATSSRTRRAARRRSRFSTIPMCRKSSCAPITSKSA